MLSRHLVFLVTMTLSTLGCNSYYKRLDGKSGSSSPGAADGATTPSPAPQTNSSNSIASPAGAPARAPGAASVAGTAGSQVSVGATVGASITAGLPANADPAAVAAANTAAVAAASTVAAAEAAGTSDIPVVPCTEVGQTHATLNTPVLNNDGTPGNYLEFVITLTDCSGKAMDFSATEPLLFDLNGQASSFAQTPPTYKVTSGPTTITGSLQAVRGSDLFNRSGSAYFHLETDKPITLAASSLVLRIDLLGQVVHPFPIPGVDASDVLETYVRYGDSTPITVIAGLIGTK